MCHIVFGWQRSAFHFCSHAGWVVARSDQPLCGPAVAADEEEEDPRYKILFWFFQQNLALLTPCLALQRSFTPLMPKTKTRAKPKKHNEETFEQILCEEEPKAFVFGNTKKIKNQKTEIIEVVSSDDSLDEHHELSDWEMPESCRKKRVKKDGKNVKTKGQKKVVPSKNTKVIIRPTQSIRIETLSLWVFKLLEFWGPKIRPKPVCLQSGENLFVCSHGHFFAFCAYGLTLRAFCTEEKGLNVTVLALFAKVWIENDLTSPWAWWTESSWFISLLCLLQLGRFGSPMLTSFRHKPVLQLQTPILAQCFQVKLRFQGQIQRSGSQVRFKSKSNSKSCLLFFIGHFQNLRHQSANQQLKPTCIDQGGAQAARPAGWFQFEPSEANLWGKWFF